MRNLDNIIYSVFLLSLFSCSRTNPPSKSPAPVPALTEIQGHRGCRGLMTENTIPAFLHAMDLGVTVLELDVCISADDQVVVSHEPWISAEICRPGAGADVPGLDQQKQPHFGQLTYAQISGYDCGGRGNERFPQQQQLAAGKPLLRDVLEFTSTKAGLLGQSVYYNIEIKSRPEWDGKEQPGPEKALALFLAEIDLAGVADRCSLQSFDYRALRLAHAQRPEIPLVQLVEENPVMSIELKRLGFNPAVYSPWFKLVTPGLVKAAHKKGIRVIPWTVNEPSDMLRMMEMGVDGLITDYPDRALSLRSVH